MNDRQALLQAVLDDPDDDLVRLVFADWLQENGEEDFAECIRVEIEWARINGDIDSDPVEERKVESRSQQANRRRTWPDYPWPESEIRTSRSRGWIDLVSCQPAAWIAHGDRICSSEPVRTLSLTHDDRVPLTEVFRAEHNRRIRHLRLDLRPTDPQIVVLGGSSTFDSLESLTIAATGWTSTMWATLSMSPLFKRMKYLNLTDTGLDDGGMKCLAGVTQPTGLVTLLLHGNRLTYRSTSRITGSASFRSLRALDLSENRLDDRAAKSIAKSPHLGGLLELWLGHNSLSAIGIAALLRSSKLAGLELLDLSGNGTLPNDYGDLFGSLSGLPSLRWLSMQTCGLSDENFAELIRLEAFSRLRYLNLGGNHLFSPSVRELCAMPGLRGNLRQLKLWNCPINNEGVRLIAETPWTQLEGLVLNDCKLTDAGIRHLAGSSHLKCLRWLSISSNSVGDDGANALAESESLPALQQIFMDANRLGKNALSALQTKYFHVR